MRITRIGAENIRAIGKVDLPLQPLTVLVGPNGVGKSTILEVVKIFSGLDNQNRFVESFARWGGFSASLRANAPDRRISMGFEISDTAQAHQYLVAFRSEGPGFFVESEHLRSRFSTKNPFNNILTRSDTRVVLDTNRGVFHSNTQHGPAPTLPHVREENIPQFGQILETAKRSSLWQLYRFQPTEKVGFPQQLQPTDLPLPDGSNLFSTLYSLKTEHRHRFRELLEALQAAIPELDEIDFPLAGAGHVSLQWKQVNFPIPFFSNQLSDGTLRFLFLVTILHSAPDDGLIALDEPELSLHPQWLMLLASLLRKTSARTNIIVATQSAEFLRWFQPEELVVADMTENGTTFTPATQKQDLNKWLEDFTLSELWAMGELGGRR